MDFFESTHNKSRIQVSGEPSEIWLIGVRYFSRSVARQEIVDYIEMFYNSRRRHSSLGYMNPMEFENQQLWKKAV